MRKVLIASFDMEVGGVERSLISMLDKFDYKNNKVHLMLYRHKGDFMSLLPNKHTLLNEVPQYSTFRKSVSELIKEKFVLLAMARILANLNARILAKIKCINEIGYYQMQIMWKYSLPFLPKLSEKYDVAISYLWPHYFIAEKVEAKTKIAWIHTDYSSIETDVDMDLKMWGKFDYIMAVSEECKNAFIKKYPSLKDKVKVMENISSVQLIRKMAEEKIEEEITKDNSFKLVSVARLSHAKGIDNAVRALKLLRDRGFENIKWYVVGYGGDERLIKQLIKENNLENNFVLLGKKINPYPYMKACDLYVQPSRYEGKAVTVSEAQILGKPVLITNYTTAKSQVNDGIDGYITELSVKGIADGIQRLICDERLRKKLIKNCESKEFDNSRELNNLYKVIK